MGWSWRRSKSFGPVRLNFSKSGVGVSVGVRGAPISAGPRGTYVHLSAGGFRYSQRLDGQVPGSPARSSHQPAPLGVTAVGQQVENLVPTGLVESNADDLLEEIKQKQAKISLAGFSALVALAGFGAFAVSLMVEVPPAVLWGTLTVGLFGLLATPWASWWDRRSRVVHIQYVLDPLGEKVQEGLERLLAAFQRALRSGRCKVRSMHGTGSATPGP